MGVVYIDLGGAGGSSVVDLTSTQVSISPKSGKYVYGELASLTLDLEGGSEGDHFYILFRSGATATEVEIVDNPGASPVGADFAPSANAICEIDAVYLNGYWSFVYHESE